MLVHYHLAQLNRPEGPSAKHLVAFVGRQVHGGAAPGVTAQGCIVLEPVAGAILVDWQPAAVRRGVPGLQRTRNVHANC